MKIINKAKEWFNKSQNLSLEARKGILFFVVAVVAVILIFFWVQQTKERLDTFQKGLDGSGVLPVFEGIPGGPSFGEDSGLDFGKLQELQQKFEDNPEEFKELMRKIGDNPDEAEKALEEFERAIEEKKNKEGSSDQETNNQTDY